MPDKLVAQLISDNFLQSFDLLVAELNHTAGLQINQMIMVGARMRLYHNNTTQRDYIVLDHGQRVHKFQISFPY